MARTTLDLDDEIISKGMAITGAPSKKALIEQAVSELTKGRLINQLRARIGQDSGLDMTLDEFLAWRRNPKRRTLLDKLDDEPTG